MIGSPDHPTSYAVFSRDLKYRYLLYRSLDLTGRMDRPIVFVMLNPSTADESLDDPTIRRCKHFTLQSGYTSLMVMNLFAYRTSQPSELKKANDPIGYDNDRWLSYLPELGVDTVICAWGNHGRFLRRDLQVYESITKMGMRIKCLAIGKTGMPKHPLYLPNDSSLQDFYMN